jgi:hypothetical protein
VMVSFSDKSRQAADSSYLWVGLLGLTSSLRGLLDAPVGHGPYRDSSWAESSGPGGSVAGDCAEHIDEVCKVKVESRFSKGSMVGG